MVFAENKMGVHSSLGRFEFPYNVFKYKNIYMTVYIKTLIKI